MEYGKMPFSEADEIFKRIERETRLRWLESQASLSPDESKELNDLKGELNASENKD